MLANLDRREMLLVCATGQNEDVHQVLDNIVQYCEDNPAQSA